MKRKELEKLAKAVMAMDLSEDQARLLNGNEILQDQLSQYIGETRPISWLHALGVIWMLTAAWRERWQQRQQP